MKRDELFQLMESEGYTLGHGNSIDREVCHGSDWACGHKGLDYYAFHKASSIPGEGYRAVYVCPKCGEADEF